MQQPDGESVLIQGRVAGQTYGNDPELRQAVRQVVAALRGCPPPPTSSRRSPAPGLASGRSALVTFNVAGNPDNDDQAVVPALNAVAAVQAHHPGLNVAEAGGASVDRATGAPIGQDFRKAEVTSLPVSLVLLLIVFGALIAAGIPLLLAGTAVIVGDLAAGDPQPLAADRRHHLLDRAAGRDGGRHRLLAVLPAPGP